MKKILILFALVPSVGFGATPGTSCPNGYTVVDRPNLTVATTCGNLSTSAGDATSCLSGVPGFSCFMYAPVGVSYVDSSGTYEYSEPCPLTE